MLFTVAHELTHFIKDWTSVKYRAMADMLVKQYQKQGVPVSELVDNQIAKAKQNGRKLSRSEAFDEVVADSMESMLADENAAAFLEKLAKRDKGLKDKVVSWLKDLAAKLKNALTAYKDVKPDSPEGKMVAEMEDFRKEIMGIYTSALVDAGENFRDNGGNKNTTREGGVKYSLNENAAVELHKALYDKSFNGEVLLRDVTPQIIVSQKGVRNLPMSMNASHIRENVFTEQEAIKMGLRTGKGINYHGIGEKFFLKIIDGLDSVKEAYRGTKNASKQERSENYFLLISTFTDKNGDIINVPVYINEHGMVNNVFLDVNKISTVFGRKNLREYIKRQVINGDLVRIKNRSNPSSESNAPIARDYGETASDYIIRNKEPVVNIKLSERDSDGRQLSDGQREYFKDSVVRDADGNLLVMYHGTPNGVFTEFRSGTYFTQNPEYAALYQAPGASMLQVKRNADNPKNYQVYLNIKKPFDTRKRKERRIFMEEYYRKYGTGAPLSESGLPDWTDGMDLQEFIEDMGYDYDGLILDEGATGGYGEEVKSRGLSYVIFSAEQVKDIDNKNPSTNPDYRFSDRDPTAEATRAALEKENGKLREDVSRLRELLRLQGKVTGGTVMKQSSIEAAARWMNKYAGAKADVKELSGMLKDFYSFLATEKDYSWEDVRERAMGIARVLQDNVQIKPQISDYARDVLREVRGIKITLDEQQRAEVEHLYGSYEAFRKAALGTVTFVKEGGIPLDSQWQEWSAMFPGTFDSEINSNDQPAALLDAIDGLRNSDTTVMEYAYNREGILQDIMRAVYDSYWRVDALVTVADRDQKTMNDLKAKQVEKVQELKGKISDKNARITVTIPTASATSTPRPTATKDRVNK